MTIMAYPTSTHRREINYWSSSDQNIKASCVTIDG